ncbi:MAG: GspE/PulE family protein [Puniceicoccales bacterium]|jgi:type II secretory ATPase GspE/PulE/Tfp pilus assembly ATPase PilB-like protein|nr:GspE/PulE family protein [Puniceicoccales bacterium]
MTDNIIFQKDGPIALFVDKILREAVALHASDIHFEIFDEKFVVRYRIDGELTTLDDCDCELARPVFSRLKVLASLNISETRLPQDGSIAYPLGEGEIEFRISCLPTQFGESVVLRILNNDAEFFALDELMRDDVPLKNFLKNITEKSGLTLFVGPTGCGKSTTLYSVLREIKSDEIKILTCEDPVEQRIDGLSQSSINSDIGFSFSNALRAFLRHDPDVIFVGEIRDRETADLAIRAAITGHCVLSTLHANGTGSAIPRLLDLGIDRTMIAEALLCVVYQQLEKIDPGQTPAHTGPGRRAKYDALFVDDALRSAIKNNEWLDKFSRA